MSLCLYFSSVSGNTEIRAHQRRIVDILDSKKIAYKIFDIASDDEAKKKMRASMEAAKKCPPYVAPQICFGDEYLGGFKEFDEAVEDSHLEAFLRL